MRILIVDDESINRFLLRHILEEDGYTELYEAVGGNEALKTFENVDPDLILLDVVMPDLNGLEVARRMKMQATQHLPIIFITSLDDEESLASCLEAGGDDFVSKPFNRVILSAKIKAHARTRQLSLDIHQQNLELTYHNNNIAREHAIVEHIFSNVLNLSNKLTKLVDYRIAPASNFNGDLFLIEQSPNGGLFMLLGDFTGHGLASAIGAIPIARAFQAVTQKGITVSEMAATFNKTLLDFLPGDMFCAAAIIEVSENGKMLDIWNGGLPHLILIDSKGNIKKRFESLHMALGILEPHDFESLTERYDAEYGDRLIGFTDGVVEVHDEEGNMLGEEGIEKWLMENPKITVEEVSRKADEFSGDLEQADDVTIVSYLCQTLGLPKKLHKTPDLPFELKFDLDAHYMRQSEPVSEVIEIVSGTAAFNGIRSSLFTVLSELYNNALDHGILRLDSSIKGTPEGFMQYFEERSMRLNELQEGSVQISIRYEPSPPRFLLELKDSGAGFDLSDVKSNRDSDLDYGRGIELVQGLASEYSYSENGTRVNVVLNIS